MSKNFYLTSLATNKLKPKEIKEICKFKNTFWKWSLPKQIDWYKSYVKKIKKSKRIKSTTRKR